MNDITINPALKSKHAFLNDFHLVCIGAVVILLGIASIAINLQ